MKEVLVTVGIVVGSILLVLVILLPIIWVANHFGTQDCVSRFGQGWESRNTFGHGPRLCVNVQGEVRYP